MKNMYLVRIYPVHALGVSMQGEPAMPEIGVSQTSSVETRNAPTEIADSTGHSTGHSTGYQGIYKPQSRLFFQANCGCGICYEAVRPAEDAIPMFCCHHQNIVHLHCLVKWCVQKRLENQPSACPFCRKLLLTTAQFDDIYEWHKYQESGSGDGDGDGVDAPESVQGTLVDRATRRIFAYFPVNTQMTELRLVRLTLFSYVTMLVNIMLLCIIFVFFVQSYSAYAHGARNYNNYAHADPQNPRPPPPPLQGPSTKHGIRDFDGDSETRRGWVAWRRARV